MKLHVLMAQRKGQYDGQYGIEAFESASEYDYDDNPGYLKDKANSLLETKEFDSIEIVTFQVNENEILKILFPDKKILNSKIIDSTNHKNIGS